MVLAFGGVQYVARTESLRVGRGEKLEACAILGDLGKLHARELARLLGIEY